MSSVPEANRPRDSLSLPGEDTTGSTANTQSKAPALVQDGAATSVQGRDIFLFSKQLMKQNMEIFLSVDPEIKDKGR